MNEDFKINNIDKWTVKPNEDGYKSPIEMIAEDVNIKIENNIVEAVQNYDIKVDREELAKALAYDRDQYSKGFAAARKEYERPQGEWIAHITYFECSNCKHCYDYDYAEDIDPVTDLDFNFCPNCGAKMGGSEK